MSLSLSLRRKPPFPFVNYRPPASFAGETWKGCARLNYCHSRQTDKSRYFRRYRGLFSVRVGAVAGFAYRGRDMDMAHHEEKKRALTQALRAAQGDIRLGKTTSNLFRERQTGAAHRLDVRDLDNVLEGDVAGGHVTVEGMTPYVKLVAECLKHGVMPAVVPQLKSITIGGAAAGCGIESSSFRYGLVHVPARERGVLLGAG